MISWCWLRHCYLTSWCLVTNMGLPLAASQSPALQSGGWFLCWWLNALITSIAIMLLVILSCHSLGGIVFVAVTNARLLNFLCWWSSPHGTEKGTICECMNSGTWVVLCQSVCLRVPNMGCCRAWGLGARPAYETTASLLLPTFFQYPQSDWLCSKWCLLIADHGSR